MVRNIINPAELGELFSDTIAIKRVSKTTKGGRVMSIAALNGHVGVGTGKAKENGEAIRKATDDAKKHLVSICLDENASVTHDYIGKYSSASILLKRAPEGTGIIAGGPARKVCELAGIRNIRTKSLGSNNKTNVALATIEGLSKLKSPEDVARNRGKSVEGIRA